MSDEQVLRERFREFYQQNSTSDQVDLVRLAEAAPGESEETYEVRALPRLPCTAGCDLGEHWLELRRFRQGQLFGFHSESCS